MKNKVEKICPGCGSIFYVAPRRFLRKKYCSKGCWMKDHAGEFICAYCKKAVVATKSLAKTKKYCSRSCKAKGEQPWKNGLLLAKTLESISKRSGENHYRFGKNCSEKTRRRMSLAKLGVSRPAFSEAWRRNMSESQRRRYRESVSEDEKQEESN